MQSLLRLTDFLFTAPLSNPTLFHIFAFFWCCPGSSFCLSLSLPLSLSLYFAPPTQTSPSWRTSPSRTWATPPSVWAGRPSTPLPSLATGSQWRQQGRAYPFLRILSCQALVNTLSTGWNLASTMTSRWLQWLKTARVSPPPSPSKPVSQLWPCACNPCFCYYCVLRLSPYLKCSVFPNLAPYYFISAF